MSLRPCAKCKFRELMYEQKPCSGCDEKGSRFVLKVVNGRPHKKNPVTTRMIQDRRKASGLCPRCGGPPEKGHTYCQKHLDYMKAYHKKHYLSKKRKVI